MKLDAYVTFIAQARDELLYEHHLRHFVPSSSHDANDAVTARDYLHGGGTVYRQSVEKLKSSQHHRIPPLGYSRTSWNRIQRETQVPSYALPKSVKELRKKMLSNAKKQHSDAIEDDEGGDGGHVKKKMRSSATNKFNFGIDDNDDCDDADESLRRKRYISVNDA